MRAHTNVHTEGSIRRALRDAEVEGVFIETLTEHRSRSHDRGFEVRLGASPGKDRNGKARRPRNSGKYGSDSYGGKAATYDEWGYFIAEFFEVDPEGAFGPYKGRADFNARTHYRYAKVSA